MKALIRSVIAAFVTIPIWLYLLYKILVLVGATELMWFLFYIYCPAVFIVALLADPKNERASE